MGQWDETDHIVPIPDSEPTTPDTPICPMSGSATCPNSAKQQRKAKVIEIHSESPAEPGVMIEMAAHHGQFILCLNKAEVKRLGLADAR